MPKRVFSRTRSPRKRTSEFSSVSDGGMFESRPFVVQSKVGEEGEKSGLKTSLMRAERYGHHVSQIYPTKLSTPIPVQLTRGANQALEVTPENKQTLRRQNRQFKRLIKDFTQLINNIKMTLKNEENQQAGKPWKDKWENIMQQAITAKERCKKNNSNIANNDKNIEQGQKFIKEKSEALKIAGKILFGQARANTKFSGLQIGEDGSKNDLTADKNVIDVANQLREGKISPDKLKVTVFLHKDQNTGKEKLVASNNRTLAALSLAGMRPTNLVKRDSTEADKKRLEETKEFNMPPKKGKQKGEKIKIELPNNKMPLTETVNDPNVKHLAESR